MSSFTERASAVGAQISSKLGRAAALYESSNDIVIIDAVRTPITRAKKGGLANTLVEDMLVAVFKALLERSGIDPSLIEDVAVGTVLSPGGGANVSRMASLAAGIPNTAGLNTLNRQCSSGLAAIMQIANEISMNQIDIGIAAGVESMTKHYGPGVMPEAFSDKVMENQEAADCLIPMGITSENVAKQYGVSREKQDKFAAESFAKAVTAQQAGYFKSEIVPVRTTQINPKTDESADVTVDSDDGIRSGVTAESLSKLKPAFSKTGSTHAGNASQVSDGAAAVLLMRRSMAHKLNLPIKGKYVTGVIAGVPPKIMGIGPAVAIPKLLKKTGIAKEEIDFWEINEAFASQAVMSIDTVGIPYEKVNLNGGAIAFGHPLGATGARQVATALSIAERTGGKLFVTSMCVGSGMGCAALFAKEDDEIEKINFNNLSSLDAVWASLATSLSKHIEQVLAEQPQPPSAEFRRALETALLDQFLNSMKVIVHGNITIGGQDYGDFLASTEQETEAFDEQLNRTLLAYQGKVQETVCENVKKRKDAPARAVNQVDTAMEHIKTATDARLAITEQELQVLRERKRLVHATLPDKTTTIAHFRSALSAIESLVDSVPEQSVRAQEALKSQATVEQLIAESQS